LPFHIADEILGLRKSQDWLDVDVIETSAGLYEIVAQRRKGDLPERIPNKPAAHRLSGYAGNYIHPGYGTTTIRLEGDKLHMALAGVRGELTHYHFELFATVLQRITAKIGWLVTFSTGTDGKESSISFSVQGPIVTFERKWTVNVPRRFN
jgi:hypothetical protein